ncbi:MAG: hypothetical protein EA396_12285 [Anaerolineaceae bacterium]|nr:MAG: hypothetical protein EA396_12285 [Anaerolineaceae bacterium]
MNFEDLPLIATSHVSADGTHYALMIAADDQKKLVVYGDSAAFDGVVHPESGALLCRLTAHNARVLRERLAWLRPIPLGTRTSGGFGDRLGCATVGHLLATAGSGVMPVLAQQSVRENARTGRTPQQVLDDAMWGAFEFGWRDGWGADADHLKAVEDIPPFVEAGYTFYTIDPGDHVDDSADSDDLPTLKRKVTTLDWTALASSPDDLVKRLSGTVNLGGLTLDLNEETILRAAVKYGSAVLHAVTMAGHIRDLIGDKSFDLEVSVDETNSTTAHVEHFYIVSELKRLGVTFTSLAPRFVGRFEKGVDYIGDLNTLSDDIAVHGAIMRHFGDSYKLSLHTGSDKFGVYPIALRHTNGLVHLKTAGTSYLEALRVMANVQPALFRDVLALAREHYEEDRKTYHVSALLDKLPDPATLTDDALAGLLDQFDARQILHVTYGSMLDAYGAELAAMLQAHEVAYHAGLKTHFDRHLAAFRGVTA